MKFYTVLFFAIIFLTSGKLFAYDIDTHAAITKNAYTQSVLADEGLIYDLGVGVFDESKYIDFGDTGVLVRVRNSFEDNIITDELHVQATSIQGWLMRGAIREDDWPAGPNPKDDPVNAIRSASHLFDPVTNSPLVSPGVYYTTAPNWDLQGTFRYFSALSNIPA